MIKIEIDENSGFCFGVIEAIKTAENRLAKDGKLYSLGDIVHNNEEVMRLANLGVATISHKQLSNLNGETVLLRAHGEPPSTYKIAKENNIDIIDATCPVVLRLQKKIKKLYLETKDSDVQIIIYGKIDHAEVNGLVGQTDGKATVIESVDHLSEINNLDYSKPIEIFSQTTKPLDGFHALVEHLRKLSKTGKIKAHDTICRQVANRIPKIDKFSKQFDLILFVGGKMSSNGRMLYEVCKKANDNSFYISSASEIDTKWLSDVKTAGICGATSTPRHLMESIAEELKKIYNRYNYGK